jgi:hypothetical protein
VRIILLSQRFMSYTRGCEGVRRDAFLFLRVLHCLQLVVHLFGRCTTSRDYLAAEQLSFMR